LNAQAKKEGGVKFNKIKLNIIESKKPNKSDVKYSEVLNSSSKNGILNGYKIKIDFPLNLFK
jgi:hypothetical protein